MSLTEEERALCAAIGFEEAVGERLKSATGRAVETMQGADAERKEFVPVAGLASAMDKAAAVDLEALQKQLPAGYRAFFAARGLMDDEVVVLRTDDPLEIVRLRATSAPNYELSHADIIAQLSGWQALYTLDISGAGHDWVSLRFADLPDDDLTDLAMEVYDFCPDIIGQHFGGFGEMAETMADEGQTLSDEMRELLEGVNWDDSEAAGLEVLRRSLRRRHAIPLWWD